MIVLVIVLSVIIHSAVTLQGLLGFCVVLGCCWCVGGRVRGRASSPNLGGPTVSVWLSHEAAWSRPVIYVFFLQQVFTCVHSPLCNWIKQMLHLSLLSRDFLFISCIVLLPPLRWKEWEQSKQQIQTSGCFCILQHLVIIPLCAWGCAMYLHMCRQVCLWFLSPLMVLLGLVRDTCAAPGWQMPCHDAGMVTPRGSTTTRLSCCGGVQNEKMLNEPKHSDSCHTLLLLQSLNSTLAV